MPSVVARSASDAIYFGLDEPIEVCFDKPAAIEADANAKTAGKTRAVDKAPRTDAPIDLATAIDAAAATKIQAAYRGHCVRLNAMVNRWMKASMAGAFDAWCAAVQERKHNELTLAAPIVAIAEPMPAVVLAVPVEEPAAKRATIDESKNEYSPAKDDAGGRAATPPVAERADGESWSKYYSRIAPSQEKVTARPLFVPRYSDPLNDCVKPAPRATPVDYTPGKAKPQSSVDYDPVTGGCKKRFARIERSLAALCAKSAAHGGGPQKCRLVLSIAPNGHEGSEARWAKIRKEQQVVHGSVLVGSSPRPLARFVALYESSSWSFATQMLESVAASAKVRGACGTVEASSQGCSSEWAESFTVFACVDF